MAGLPNEENPQASVRLESGRGKGSPSLATLRKYAHALGYRLDFRLTAETETAN